MRDASTAKALLATWSLKPPLRWGWAATKLRKAILYCVYALPTSLRNMSTLCHTRYACAKHDGEKNNRGRALVCTIVWSTIDPSPALQVGHNNILELHPPLLSTVPPGGTSGATPLAASRSALCTTSFIRRHPFENVQL